MAGSADGALMCLMLISMIDVDLLIMTIELQFEKATLTVLSSHKQSAKTVMCVGFRRRKLERLKTSARRQCVYVICGDMSY